MNVPITAKIRLLPSMSDTIDLLRLIESTGVKAVTIHGRWNEHSLITLTLDTSQNGLGTLRIGIY